eukprot:PhM_4_TR3593/c0_g1_i1/m.61700/K00889/PIP5K; 1-phosphatidylinositol-4-phosphate 5-kinase
MLEASETYCNINLAEVGEIREEPKSKKTGNRMGTLVVKGHESHKIVTCMKRALSKSIISISKPEKARPLNPKKDFTIKAKVQFAGRSTQGAQGSSWSCCRKADVVSPDDGDATEPFVFTDYSPMCYCHIRSFLKVDWRELHAELCEGEWSTIQTPGKSAALLYFCGTKWVVKTMSKGESKFLRQILHRYYYHVKNNPYTLLPHFVGHHSITMSGKKTTFIIMRNVFETPYVISEKYDLKGSTVGRYACQEERTKTSCTWKDLDVSRHICVGESRREILLQQVRRDCDFLHKASIMDYSFLLGVYKLEPGDCVVGNLTLYFDERCFKCDDGGMLSEPSGRYAGEIYYIGIIDILQEYTAWKASETVVRGVQYDRDKISSVPPKQYAQRFIRFLDSIVI